MQHNIQKSAELHLLACHETVYLYNLAYRGKFSFLPKSRYGNTRYDLGMYHIRPTVLCKGQTFHGPRNITDLVLNYFL